MRFGNDRRPHGVLGVDRRYAEHGHEGPLPFVRLVLPGVGVRGLRMAACGACASNTAANTDMNTRTNMISAYMPSSSAVRNRFASGLANPSRVASPSSHADNAFFVYPR